MACLLALSLPEHDAVLAEFPQSPGLGRIRGFDLPHDFAGVLVHGTDSRSCDLARSHGQSSTPENLRFAGHGMAGFRASLAPLRDGLSAARRTGHAAGALGAYGGEL